MNAFVRAGGYGLLASLALGMAASCGRKTVHRSGEEWLEAIKVEGNRSVKTKDLRNGLALRRVQKQGTSPDPYLVVVDGKRIEGEYIRRGFLEVDVRSRVERKGDRTTVIYTVQEGPRAKTRVLITGIPKDDPDLTEQKIRAALPIREGEFFSYRPYDEAKERMLGIIEDAGYAHAVLNAHVIVERSTHEAIVHLDYEVGPKCKFGDIRIVGASEELEEAVRARLAFEPGERYSAAAIAESQRRIYDMRRFSMVRVLPDKSQENADVINIEVSLARSARNELTAGGGVGMDPSTYEVRGRTGYQITGWPFPLTDVSIDLRPAYAMLREREGYEPRVRAMSKIRRIDLFRPFITGEVEGGYNYLTVEAYTSYGPRGRLGVQSPLFTRALQVRAGYEIERLDFRNFNPILDAATITQLGLDGTQRVGQYTQAVSLDLRDNPIEPRLGAFAEIRVDEGTPYAGGEFTFLRLTPELRGFLSTPRLPVVLATRARVGRIYGDLPVTERYFSGGSTTQRGFGERRLAPVATGIEDGETKTVPIGGAELVEANAELRTRIGKVKGMGVGVVAFLDGADVADEGKEVDFQHLHWATGLGIRLHTIVGAVRTDLGYRLNRTGPMDPDPGSRFTFHLSIGEAF